MESKETAKLFDEDEEENENEVPDFLNIENDYAKKYNDWRRKEELQKLKDKYGDQLDVMSEIEDNDEDGNGGDSEGNDESTSETTEEEEDPFDEDFFKVYSALKADDPALYDKSYKFFDEKTEEDKEKIIEEGKSKKSKKIPKGDQEKTLTLPEYHRKLVEERKGVTEEDEEQVAPPRTTNGYYQELSNIKDEIKNIVGDDDDEDEDDLFIVKETREKVSSNHKEVKEKSKFLSTFWNDNKKLDTNEEFLKDYIVNQRYRDDEKTLLEQARRMANTDSHFGGFDKQLSQEGDDTDDNNKVQRPSIDVAKFHFEEPDATTIKRFPRNLTSVRDAIKPATSKRAEVRERKRKEKETELKRLRRLKREEMETKLAKLKETAGIDAPLDLKTLDLNIIVDDEAFDPDKYDEKMKLIFGDHYYHEKEEKSKPKFDYFPEIDDDLYDEQTNVMPKIEEEEDGASKKSKKKTKKDIKRSKDIMADDDIGIFEDIVGGDLATRFRYRMVEPNDFGLTDEEILLADEKELNQWVSLKKMSQYRPKHFEDYDRKVYQRKAADIELKKKILKSLYGDHNHNGVEKNKEDHQQNEEQQESQQKKKTKKGKRRRKAKSTLSTQFNVTEIEETKIADEDKQGEKSLQRQQQQQQNGRKRKRKHKKNVQSVGGARSKNLKEDKAEIDRLKAYGMSNREIKRLKTKI